MITCTVCPCAMTKRPFSHDVAQFLFSGLISCVRHLSVKSIITPITDEDETLMEDESTETCLEEDCEECKKKLQVALIDTLPHPVGSGRFTR